MPACCALVSQCSAQADLTLTVFGASRFDNITVVINVTSRGYKRSTTCSPLPPPDVAPPHRSIQRRWSLLSAASTSSSSACGNSRQDLNPNQKS